jgi:hypothetical protein
MNRMSVVLTMIKRIRTYIEKDGRLDHFSPVGLQSTYIAKQQILNSGFF